MCIGTDWQPYFGYHGLTIIVDPSQAIENHLGLTNCHLPTNTNFEHVLGTVFLIRRLTVYLCWGILFSSISTDPRNRHNKCWTAQCWCFFRRSVVIRRIETNFSAIAGSAQPFWADCYPWNGVPLLSFIYNAPRLTWVLQQNILGHPGPTWFLVG